MFCGCLGLPAQSVHTHSRNQQSMLAPVYHWNELSPIPPVYPNTAYRLHTSCWHLFYLMLRPSTQYALSTFCSSFPFYSKRRSVRSHYQHTWASLAINGNDENTAEPGILTRPSSEGLLLPTITPLPNGRTHAMFSMIETASE